MKKFVFIYNHEDHKPTKEIMDAWMAWFGTIEHAVDTGNPFGEGKEIVGGDVSDIAGDAHRAGGYSIINAADMDEAIEIAGRCPGAAGIRVYEAVSM